MFAAILLVLGVPSLFAQAGADPQQRIERTLEQAVAAGIPTSLLESKVAEGRAKGIAMEQIAQAVENRLGALTRARTVMNLRDGEWTPADLSVGADALQGGVSEQTLRTLSRSAPPAHRAAAIVVLTHLVQQGEDSQQALARVQAALARGPEALRNLPAEARERRGPPEGRRSRPPAAENRGNSANAAGRQGGGPPAAVPAPGRGVGSENPKKDKDRPGRPNQPGGPNNPNRP